MTDVVLDATVGLHRCVDLIPAAESVPDDIRGAILAAIAAEQPPQLADPGTQPAPIRSSAITDSGAILVATGITLAADAVVQRWNRLCNCPAVGVRDQPLRFSLLSVQSQRANSTSPGSQLGPET